MKKMIITGVNGFIGRCAMEYFSKDYEITGIDLADRYCEDRAEIHYYQCNMSKDSQELANIFTGVQPDVILHCAGSANVGASIVNPMADLDGNLHSLYQLLLALQSFEKRPKIIFFSSAGVYGNPKQLPITEFSLSKNTIITKLNNAPTGTDSTKINFAYLFFISLSYAIRTHANMKTRIPVRQNVSS